MGGGERCIKVITTYVPINLFLETLPAALLHEKDPALSRVRARERSLRSGVRRWSEPHHLLVPWGLPHQGLIRVPDPYLRHQVGADHSPGKTTLQKLGSIQQKKENKKEFKWNANHTTLRKYVTANIPKTNECVVCNVGLHGRFGHLRRHSREPRWWCQVQRQPGRRGAPPGARRSRSTLLPHHHPKCHRQSWTTRPFWCKGKTIKHESFLQV